MPTMRSWNCAYPTPWGGAVERAYARSDLLEEAAYPHGPMGRSLHDDCMIAIAPLADALTMRRSGFRS